MIHRANDDAPTKATGRRISGATREARSRALADQSPRERGLHKALEALRWLHDWGWSSSRILNALVGTSGGNSLGARLEKNGWARRQSVRLVGDYRAVPTDVLTITSAGYAQLAALTGEDFDSRITAGPSKQMLVHDAQVQWLTLLHMGRLSTPPPAEFASEFGAVTTYAPARQLGRVDRHAKRPDVTWTVTAEDEMGDPLLIDVEVERSPKWDRELDQFVLRHAQRQAPDDDGEYDADHLLVYFTSAAARDRYANALTPGRLVRKWFWDAHARKWKPGEADIKHHWTTISQSFRARCLMVPQDLQTAPRKGRPNR